MISNNSIRNEIKATCLLAAPITISSLVQVANGFIDTVMLGRFHPEHLAAGALGAAIWLFVSLAGLGFVAGLAPIVAQHNGANKQHLIANVFQQGVWICLLIAILAFLGLRNFGGLLELIGTDASIIPLANDYLVIVSWGAALSQMYMAGRFVSEGIEYVRPMMIIQLVLLPVNALGNYVLIFGNWGFPELGATGAAIATSITLSLGLFLMLLNLIYNQRYRDLALFKKYYGIDFSRIKEILVISIPIAVSMILESSLFTSISLLMGRLGVLPLAGHQIAINYASLMFMFPLGLALAATVRVGNAVGRSDYEDARLRGWVAIGLSLIFMICSACVLLLFNKQIAMVYTSNSEVISVAVSLLVLAGVFQISDGLQISAAGALRGYKDTKVPMYICLLGYWMIGFPCAYYLGFIAGFKATGLWWGLIVGLAIAAVLLVSRYHFVSKKPTNLKAAVVINH